MPTDPLKPLKDQAARNAIITSGIVGLTTAIMVKGLDIDIRHTVSLPVGVATAISLDYLVNYNRNKAAVIILKSEYDEFVEEVVGLREKKNRNGLRSNFLRDSWHWGILQP